MSTQSTAAAPAAELACQLSAAASVAIGAPVLLHFTLVNRGATSVQVLTWGTPFEGGFFAPFVRVLRDGQALAYAGAAVKRGEPTRDEYLFIGAGSSLEASVGLQPAFALDAPGRYRVEPQIVLHDVVVGASARVPRPRDRHRSVELPCASVEVTLR